MLRHWRIVMGVVAVGLVAVPAHAQVFAPDANATTGLIFPGDGQALYGTFGLNAASNSSESYSVYRKFQPLNNFPPPLPPAVAENLSGDPSSVRWSGLHQGGPNNGDTGYIAPGMFIGNTPSTTSYPSQLMNFGPVIDGTSSTGVVPPSNDANNRRDWDVRFGFLEDPTGFVDSREPNSPAFDLWDGNWNSDGVMFHFGMGAKIDVEPDTGSTDWYVYPRVYANSFVAQSGDPTTFISTQEDRDGMEFTGHRAGSGESIQATRQRRTSANVSYEDRLEVSWKLEPNDPTNPDPVRAREVKMSAKLGNLIYEGIFDPGSPTSPVQPNPVGDPGVTYTDGYFDWQNATPVIYLGPTNETSAGATAIQGVFIPGDINADGIASAADRAKLNNYLGQIDTSYSRGDLDQDGDTDANDLAILDGILAGVGPVRGDFNQDGTLDALDIDELTRQSAAGSNNVQYDLTNDGLVNSADVAEWITADDIYFSWIGDANLDEQFDSGDLVAVLASGTYENNVPSVWSTGDFTGDGRTDSGDLVAALSGGGYENGPRAATAAAVPEPTAGLLWATAMLWLAGSLRLRRP